MQAEAGAMWGKGHEPWGVVHLKAGSFFWMAEKAWEDLYPADTRGKEARTLAPEL